MQKLTDNQQLDIPADDAECWERYPKHRWVYELSRLFDAQHIKWSPYNTAEFNTRLQNIMLSASVPDKQDAGYIYIKETEGAEIYTEVFIVKGEIKLMKHTTDDTIIGGVELRISAFVTLHFQKFTGVISVKTIGNDIFGISLRPITSMLNVTNQEALKLIKRIYKKNSITLSGLTDRVLQETLAS